MRLIVETSDSQVQGRTERQVPPRTITQTIYRRVGSAGRVPVGEVTYEVQRQRQFREEPARSEEKEQYRYILKQLAVEEQRRKESEAFYARIDYPQYAGKYEPFTIQPGYSVSAITETTEGLQISFIPTAQPQKGVAETLATFEIPKVSLFGLNLPSYKPLGDLPGRQQTLKPFMGVAGLIAPTEALVYSVARLGGLQTPEIPPTVLSFSPSEAFKYGAEYAAGTIVGDILLSIGIGKAVSYAARPITKPIQAKIGDWLTQKWIRGEYGLTEKIIGKVSGARPYLASQIVSVPSVEQVGLKGLQAQFLAWELSETPRSSAYLISKMPGENLAKAWATEHLVKSVMGGIAYASVKGELMKTSQPILPYAPQSVMVKQTSFAGLIGFTFIGLKTIQKTKTTIEPYEIQKLRIQPFQIEKPSRQEREQLLPTLKSVSFDMSLSELTVSPLQISRTHQKQPQTVKQIQIQKQIVSQATLMRQLQTQVPKFPKDLDIFKPKRKRKGKKGFLELGFGRAWYAQPPSPKAFNVDIRKGLVDIGKVKKRFGGIM